MLLLYLREMRNPELLVNGELFLRILFLTYMHEVCSEPVMRVGQVRVKFQRALLLGNRLGILVLVGVEVSQLHVSIRKRIVQFDGSFQQRLDRGHIGI